jgi:hypothetical protein
VITHVGSRFVPEGGDGDLSGHCDSVTTSVAVELSYPECPRGSSLYLLQRRRIDAGTITSLQLSVDGLPFGSGNVRLGQD